MKLAHAFEILRDDYALLMALVTHKIDAILDLETTTLSRVRMVDGSNNVDCSPQMLDHTWKCQHAILEIVEDFVAELETIVRTLATGPKDRKGIPWTRNSDTMVVDDERKGRIEGAERR